MAFLAGDSIKTARSSTVKSKPRTVWGTPKKTGGTGVAASPGVGRTDALGRTGFGSRSVASLPNPITSFDHSPAGRKMIADYTRPSSTGDGGGGTGTGGGGGGGGGSTGGGGTNTSVTDSDKEAKEAKEAQDAEAVALNATLDAIAAQYGMTRKQLLADQGEAGRQYRMAVAGLRRERNANMESVFDSMAARGILQSGETLENTNAVQAGFAEQQAQARGNRAYTATNVAAQLAALGPQQAAEEATAKASSARTKLDLEQMRALAGL